MFFEKLSEYSVYENPQPVLRSRCALFPGMVRLPSGELIAMFQIGEAFEAVNCRTHISRSLDSGQSWRLQGELFDMARLGLDFPVSDSLKPLLLRDGTLLATGYWFHRNDPERPIGNPETGGVLPAEAVACTSQDGGQTWTLPKVISHPFSEPVELSGPCVETGSGDVIGVGALFKAWDGHHNNNQKDVLFRSRDKGKSWDTGGRFFKTPGKHIVPFESRLIEMQPGRLVALVWAYDMLHDKSLPNMVTVSHDDGKTWSPPMDTGVMGQASNLMWLGGDRLLAIHAQREQDIGLYLRLVDFKNDEWKSKEEGVIWGDCKSGENPVNFIDHCQALKFGQPALLSLGNGELLAYHWCVEDMLYKIKAHRLRLHL